MTVPALRSAREERPLLTVFLMSTAAIALLYGAGLFLGRHTHLSIVEYWRWWVVHLWVDVVGLRAGYSLRPPRTK